MLHTTREVERNVSGDPQALISSPNIPEKIWIELQQIMAIKAGAQSPPPQFSPSVTTEPLCARAMSCRLILASSTLLSSSHLENLIIYTSAPLDAVPVNRLQVWMKPGQSRAKDEEWKTERELEERAWKGEREICFCRKWGKENK